MFRQRAIANGWAALASRDCMSNVVGGKQEALCKSDDPPAHCALCTQLPELESCSGDGYCLVQFTHPGTRRVMQVTTYGALDGWGAIVTGWVFEDAPSYRTR